MPKAKSRRQSRLLEARLAHGVSQKELAERLGVTASYLSRIEGRDAEPPPKLRAAYARELGIPELQLEAPDAETLGGEEIRRLLSLIHDEVVGTQSATPVRQIRKAASLREVGPELVDRRALVGALHAYLQHSSGSGTIVWDSRNPLPAMEMERAELLSSIEGFIRRGNALTLVIRLGSTPRSRVDMYEFSLRCAIRHLKQASDSGLFRCLFLTSIGFHRFPMDIYLFGNDHCIQAFPTAQPYQVDSGHVVRDTTHVIRRHVELMAAHAGERSVVYAPDRSDDWVAYVSGLGGGDQFVCQPFFLWSTRPPTDFREGTMWYARAVATHSLPHGQTDKRALERFISMKRNVYSRFLDGAARHRIRHICDRAVIEEWWRTGTRTDVMHTSDRDNPADRRRRLDTVIEHLRQYDKFELALVPDYHRYSGLSEGNSGAHALSWMVSGVATFTAEVQTPDSGVPELWHRFRKLGHDKVGLSINDEGIVSHARTLFDATWNRIPPLLTDRRNVIEQLERIKDMPVAQ